MDAFGFHLTPIGALGLAESGGTLTRIWLPEEHPSPTPATRLTPVLVLAFEQLDAYFAGRSAGFTPRINPTGTPFQQTVWAALSDIPFGQTRTYGELAHRIGRPGAARAVGMACNHNPIPVLIPCHRAVAAHGIGGFRAGTGIKRALLALEGSGLAIHNRDVSIRTCDRSRGELSRGFNSRDIG